MSKPTYFRAFRLFFILSFLLGSVQALACDTSPVISASNVQNIGGGFYTVDVQVCVGTDGSQDGFDLTMGCGLNITGFSPASLTNAGNTANGSITGGVLTYTYNPTPPTSWFAADDGVAGPCFNVTLTVNGNPENCTVTTTGVNDGCLIIQSSWSTTIPGPCITNYSMTAPGSQSGNTSGGGNTCTTRASQDNIIQVIIPCDDTWTFSLCGGSSWDTYLYLGTTCCGGTITQNDDACGLQSQLSTFLAAGTYYVTVEAYSSSTTGSYTLNVTSANPCTPLPADYILFDGEYNEDLGLNVVNWTTASENDVDYFAVEKSFDGENFEQIGVVTGAGNSVIENQYVFIDQENNRGTAYYRLRQVDFDGSIEYSSVIAIGILTRADFMGAVYPNPSSGIFNVEIAPSKTEEPILLQVFNSIGNEVYSETMPGSTATSIHEINLNELPSGVYSIILSNSEKREIEKITIVE